MDVSTLSYSEAQDYDHLKYGSLWIRIIESDSGSFGEIIKITNIEKSYNYFIIYFKVISERTNKTFSKNFISYYGTKKAKDHDTDWLKTNYKG